MSRSSFVVRQLSVLFIVRKSKTLLGRRLQEKFYSSEAAVRRRLQKSSWKFLKIDWKAPEQDFLFNKVESL